jgi:hypothetical protein
VLAGRLEVISSDVVALVVLLLLRLGCHWPLRRGDVFVESTEQVWVGCFQKFMDSWIGLTPCACVGAGGKVTGTAACASRIGGMLEVTGSMTGGAFGEKSMGSGIGG